MARRAYPIATVALHQYGRRYTIQEDTDGNSRGAWCWYADAGRLMNAAETYGLDVSTEKASILGVRDAAPQDSVPLARYHDAEANQGMDSTSSKYPAGLNVFYLNPFWWNTPVAPTTAPENFWAVDPASIVDSGLDVDEALVEETMPEQGDKGVMAEVPLIMTSSFAVGPNCWWSIALWREKTESIDEDGAEYATEDLTTEVVFGYGWWRIYWPRSKGPELHYWSDGAWRHGCSINANTQYEEGQCLHLTIGVLRGHIMLFDQVDKQWTTYNSAKDRWGSTDFPWMEQTLAGNIAVRNSHGNMFVEVSPVVFKAATIYGSAYTGRVLQDPASPQDPAHPEGFWCMLGGHGTGMSGPCLPLDDFAAWPIDGSPAWANTPGSLQVAVKPRAVGSRILDWRVRMTPFEYADPTGVTTYATPYWCSLSLWQAAQLDDEGEPAITRTLTDEGCVIDLRVDEPDGEGPLKGTFNLYNRDGEAQSIPDARLISITAAGWRMKLDGTNTEMSEVALNFAKFLTMEAQMDGKFGATMDTTDTLGTLAFTRFDQGCPVFDGLSVTDAITWLLESVGIGPEWYNLEDLGVLFPYGKWEEPKWQPERGRDYLAYIKEVLENIGGNAGIWCDNNVIKTGCRYCRTQRTAANWREHDGQWYDGAVLRTDGCRAADLARAGGQGVDVELYADPGNESVPGNLSVLTEVSRTSTRIDPEEYANYVSVGGEDQYNRKFFYYLQNTADLARSAMGFPMMKVETPPGIQSYGEAVDRCLALAKQLFVDPIKLEGTALWDPNIRRGYIMRTHTHPTSQLNINHLVWRITSASHEISRSKPYTRITARKLGGLEPV